MPALRLSKEQPLQLFTRQHLLPGSTEESLLLSQCRSWCQRGLIPTFHSAHSCACWVCHRTWQSEALPAALHFHQQAPGSRRKVLSSHLAFQSSQSSNKSSKPETNSRLIHPLQQRAKFLTQGDVRNANGGLHRSPDYNSIILKL